jgi:3-deoxy-manno-octulosonate cytidylyltransferase (CMP-KDO synthetase)
MTSALVLIPARMGAMRLPGKPLALIHDLPMIVHVWRRAVDAAIGPVAVATDSTEIISVIEAAGGQAVLTDSAHASGTDRIHEAAQILDPDKRHAFVLNLQGDLPDIPPAFLREALLPFSDPSVDCATLAAPILLGDEIGPDVVKVIGTECAPRHLRALYFTRARAPWGDGILWHHIGLYAWRREALDRFVSLPPSPLETRERLEQLRALEAGMRIDVCCVEGIPVSVDTPDDLEKARRRMQEKP